MRDMPGPLPHFNDWLQVQFTNSDYKNVMTSSPRPLCCIESKNLECPMKKFFRDDQGATAIEYGLIAAAMGLALVTALPSIKNAIKTKFASIGTHISTGT